jgi:hypothetical protein
VQVPIVVQELWGFGLVGLGVRHWSYCEQCDRVGKGGYRVCYHVGFMFA